MIRMIRCVRLEWGDDSDDSGGSNGSDDSDGSNGSNSSNFKSELGFECGSLFLGERLEQGGEDRRGGGVGELLGGFRPSVDRHLVEGGSGGECLCDVFPCRVEVFEGHVEGAVSDDPTDEFKRDLAQEGENDEGRPERVPAVEGTLLCARSAVLACLGYHVDQVGLLLDGANLGFGDFLERGEVVANLPP